MTEEVEDMKGKVLEEVEDTKANVLEELQTRLKDLYSELHLTKNALTNALSKLAAKDRQIDRSDTYNESLRTEIESLSLQIEGYRSAQTNRQDAQVQTNAEEILTAMAEKPFPAWNAELKQSEPATDAALSIEETLKATAEAALQQTGFVYDENTRLYYDYNSGYYYDGEQSLYYDPTCGTYFYYDEITGEYTFHSQIDAKTFRQYNHLIKKAQSEATHEMGDGTDGKISDRSSTDIQTKTSLTSGTADRRDLVKKNKELDKNRKETDKRRKETDKRRKKPKDDELTVRTQSGRCLIRLCTTHAEQQTPRLSKAVRKPKTLRDARFGFLVIPAIAFGFGTWQIKQWRWKISLIEDLEKRTEVPAIPLPENLDELQDMEYRKVTIRGTFDHSREMLIGPRSNVQDNYSGSDSNQGLSSTGVNVVTPFKLADRDLTILVNRGWVPRNISKENKRDGQEEGEVTLTAVVRHNEKRNAFIFKEDYKSLGYWLYRDIEAMATVANTAPVFLDADLESTVKGGPLGGQTTVQLRNDHFSYILICYCLSAITFSMWYKMYKKPPLTESVYEYLKKTKH